MNDFLELLAVFAAIYLFDCVHWARRGTVAFRRLFGSRVRVLEGEDMPGNERYGVVFAQPLPPFGRLFLTQHAALSLTPETACSFVAQAANPGTRPPQVERAVRYDAIRSIAVEARSVLVDGALFVETGSNRSALRTAEWLESMRALDPKARDRAIARELERSLDAGAAAARIAEFEAATSGLTTICTAAFVVLFLLVPALGLRFGLALAWIPSVAAIALAQFAMVVAFVRAHRRLHAGEKRARRNETVLLALSPPAALRGPDVLSRDFLAEFHPLAVAAVVLDDEAFEEFAVRVLRDARHPLPIVRDGGDEAVRRADLEWRERLVSALETFAVKRGLRRERWTSAPPRLEPDCQTYCPRCSQQFTLAAGHCTRCWGLPLVRW
jgi:hypothetical protein